MAWFRRWQMRRAAKQYAGRLGSHLARAYGPSEFYSAGQIRAAVAKLGLNPRFIALGYAAFLTENEYPLVAAGAPFFLSNGEARTLFERYRLPNLFSASSNPETSITIVGVGSSDH